MKKIEDNFDILIFDPLDDISINDKGGYEFDNETNLKNVWNFIFKKELMRFYDD